MSIQLQAQPVTANAALSEADVTAIVNALTGVVTLPQGESFANVVALNVTIQPTGTGVLNVRFNK